MEFWSTLKAMIKTVIAMCCVALVWGCDSSKDHADSADKKWAPAATEKAAPSSESKSKATTGSAKELPSTPEEAKKYWRADFVWPSDGSAGRDFDADYEQCLGVIGPDDPKLVQLASFINCMKRLGWQSKGH